MALPSGDSHLRDRQRDGREIFQSKNARWAEYWIAHEYPVMLVIRTSDGTICWLNTDHNAFNGRTSGNLEVPTRIVPQARRGLMSLRGSIAPGICALVGN